VALERSDIGFAVVVAMAVLLGGSSATQLVRRNNSILGMGLPPVKRFLMHCTKQLHPQCNRM
jgi:hypothetical protein